jgi:hypothetical protein
MGARHECLVWKDAALLLACFTLHTYAEMTVAQTIMLYLTENVGATNMTTQFLLGVVAIVHHAIALIAGPLLDQWPVAGPLRALSFTEPVRIVAVFAVLAIGRFEPVDASFTFVLIAAIFVCVYAVADGLSSMAYLLSINSLVRFRMPSMRPRILQLRHMLVNAAAIGSFCTTYFWRSHVSPPSDANVCTIASGLVIWTLATIASTFLSCRLERKYTMVAASSLKGQLVGIHGAICALCDRRLLRRLRIQFRSNALLRYIGLVIADGGMTIFYVQMTTTLVQYMIRRYDLVTDFAIAELINPALIIVLSLILVFTPLVSRPNWSYPVFIVGRFIQATAPLWLYIGGTRVANAWPIEAFFIHVTIGEAIAEPRLDEMKLQIAPRQHVSMYNSIGMLPHMALQFAAYGLSGGLLDRYCATAETCKEPIAPAIWLFFHIVTMSTPLALGLFWLIIERSQSRATR